MNRIISAICASALLVTAATPVMATSTTIGEDYPSSPAGISVDPCDPVDRLEGLCGKPPREECDWGYSCEKEPRPCWNGPDPRVMRGDCKNPCEDDPLAKRCVGPERFWDRRDD